MPYPPLLYTHFFSGIQNFLFRSRVFSRALGCGARRGPACTPRCKCGSRPGSVARSLGVQSYEIWQENTGSLSDQLEPTRPTQNPQMGFFPLIFHLSLLLFLKCHSSRQRLGSHGTTAALQAFPFVIATNGSIRPAITGSENIKHTR